MHTVANTSLRAVLILGIAVAMSFAATPPDFSGKWTLDNSRSQGASGESIELTIQQMTGGKIDYKRILRERDGKQIQMTFTCTADGTTCDLDENGHKAKVSLWYDGSALVMAKTNGESRDSTTERTFTLSPDGKTLIVEFTNYSGSGKPEKLVFSKQ
jgi:hypothetical protein